MFLAVRESAEPAMADGTEPVVEGQRADIASLVRAHVKVRFALTGDAFADHLRARVQMGGAGDPIAYAETLRLDDLYLATACAQHDELAWSECFERHFAFLRDFARRFLRGAEADDVVDRVVGDLWEQGKIARYEGRSTLRTWLAAVLCRAALNAGKVIRRNLAPAVDVDSIGELPARASQRMPEDDDAARLLAGLASEVLSSLDAETRVLLLLHYEQGMTLDRMAPVLGSSKATLSRRLKSSREQIRADIERLALERYGLRIEAMSERLDVSRLELDLSALLGGFRNVKESGDDTV